MKKNFLFSLILLLYSSMLFCQSSGQWTVEQAKSWYAGQPFMTGCNFLPSTAINQIEMWQTSTWDPKTIDRELGWASDMGFNTVRVFLHDVVYTAEKKTFLIRIDQFLKIASKHGIKPLFVFWDDCHYSLPKIGKQPDMIPGVHNSGWKQSPGYQTIKAYSEGTLDKKTEAELEDYIKGVLSRFKNDKRILGWDLYNEMGQSYCNDLGLKLLQNTWKWAWEIRPSQPLTACVNGSNSEMAREINAHNSDVYSFHNYGSATDFASIIANSIKAANGRPVFCTEYMARPFGNTFEVCLPMLKESKIANWCWGFVDGKSGTKWDWGTRSITVGSAVPIPKNDPSNAPKDPKLWFHDVLHPDGTPYMRAEVDFIKSMMDK